MGMSHTACSDLKGSVLKHHHFVSCLMCIKQIYLAILLLLYQRLYYVKTILFTATLYLSHLFILFFHLMKFALIFL